MKKLKKIAGRVFRYIWYAVASPFYIGDYFFKTVDVFDLGYEWKDWFHTISPSYSAEEYAMMIFHGAYLTMITTTAFLIGAVFIFLVLMVLVLVVCAIVEFPLIGWIFGSFFIVPTVLIVGHKALIELTRRFRD